MVLQLHKTWLKHWMVDLGDKLKKKDNIICQSPQCNSKHPLLEVEDDMIWCTPPPTDAEHAYWKIILDGSITLVLLSQREPSDSNSMF